MTTFCEEPSNCWRLDVGVLTELFNYSFLAASNWYQSATPYHNKAKMLCVLQYACNSTFLFQADALPVEIMVRRAELQGLRREMKESDVIITGDDAVRRSSRDLELLTPIGVRYFLWSVLWHSSISYTCPSTWCPVHMSRNLNASAPSSFEIVKPNCNSQRSVFGRNLFENWGREKAVSRKLHIGKSVIELELSPC